MAAQPTYARQEPVALGGDGALGAVATPTDPQRKEVGPPGGPLLEIHNQVLMLCITSAWVKMFEVCNKILRTKQGNGAVVTNQGNGAPMGTVVGSCLPR